MVLGQRPERRDDLRRARWQIDEADGHARFYVRSVTGWVSACLASTTPLTVSKNAGPPRG
jgi:hypothetical protein